MESLGIIEVKYDRAPVWLEELRGDMAEVTFINSGRRASIPLAGLVEEQQ